MNSSSLRTATLALIECKHPLVTDPVVLLEYADSLDYMAKIADAANKPTTAYRYVAKANVLRMRASRY